MPLECWSANSHVIAVNNKLFTCFQLRWSAASDQLHTEQTLLFNNKNPTVWLNNFTLMWPQQFTLNKRCYLERNSHSACGKDNSYNFMLPLQFETRLNKSIIYIQFYDSIWCWWNIGLHSLPWCRAVLQTIVWHRCEVKLFRDNQVNAALIHTISHTSPSYMSGETERR